MNEKQEKAKREQKIFAAILASMVVIFTYMFVRDNIWWVLLALTYAAIVVSVIFYELIDEAWIEARIREYNNSTPEEPEPEPVKMDIIS